MLAGLRVVVGELPMIGALVVACLLAFAYGYAQSFVERLIIVAAAVVFVCGLAWGQTFEVDPNGVLRMLSPTPTPEVFFQGRTRDTLRDTILHDAIVAPTRSPTTYVPPPTPQPTGRPKHIECWQPDAFHYAGITSDTKLGPSTLFCCYEWRGWPSGAWAFLQCTSGVR